MNNISLDGNWEFQLDPEDAGRRERWWHRDGLADRIKVPGCWQAQGFGWAMKHTISQMGHPALQVERHGYRDAAWYRKVFRLPAEWRDRRIRLHFGGVHPRAEFWCNGHYLGRDPGGLLEFDFDITRAVRRRAENALTVRVAEHRGGDWIAAFDGGIYNWAAIWSGLYRGVSLQSCGAAWVENFCILPCLRRKLVRVNAAIRHSGLRGKALNARIRIIDPDGKLAAEISQPCQARGRAPTAAAEITLQHVVPWSLENPRLYQAQVILMDGPRILDERAERFGLRDIAVRGRRITLNGRPVFLRGFGWNMVFPRTLSPDLDKNYIRKQLRTAREFGFNAIDTYCLPYRELLDTADEEGMLIQVFPGDIAGTALTRRAHLEQLMRQAMNHPSIISYGWSAEQYGNDRHLVENLDRLYDFAKKTDPTRLSLGRDGSHLVNFGHGKSDFEEPACCYRTSYPDKLLRRATGKPVLLHELGWFSSYPNPALKRKYRNLPLLPFHITCAEEAARRQGVAGLLPAFVRNSERLQAMERKMAVECLRKTAVISGYHLWMGHDTASAVEGIWDDFGDPKNVSAAECRQYNGDTVLLMRQDFRGLAAWVVPSDGMPESNPHDICREWQGRNLWEGETLKADILTSHYGARPLRGAELRWTLTAEPSGRPLAAGMAKNLRAPAGTTTRLAGLRLRIPRLRRAVKMALRVELRAHETSAVNQWDFWGFPRAASALKDGGRGVYGYGKTGRSEYGMDLENAGVARAPVFFADLPRVQFAGHHLPPPGTDIRLVVSLNQLSHGLIDYLEQGGRVWLLAENLFPEYFHRFRSIPWHQLPFGNSGTIVRRHPALKNFPHEGFCDLQFYDLTRTAAGRKIQDGGAVNLDIWPVRIEPIIRSIDSYMGARRRGLLFEAGVGRGRLLVSRLNFVDTPAARLLAGELVRYMLESDRRPEASVPPGFLRHFVNQRG